jgi:predicted metalloprotease with PDZ domain
VLLPEDAFGECARVVSVDTPVFDRGWDTEATTRQGDVVTGLDPTSMAYAAGLREGMKLLSQSGGNPADPQVEITLVAQDASGQHRIRFRPVGRATVRLQHIAFDAARFSARPEACRQALAG